MATKQTTSKTAIVVGAGAGGIATAARLAKAGYHVTVVEKNDFIGGRCSLLYSSPSQPETTSKSTAAASLQNQYRFDQGPSLLLLPNLFRETFHDLDTSLEAEGVDLLRCPENYQIFFHDGEVFKPCTDLAAMKAQIEHYEGKGGFESYLAWMAESHQHYELSVEHVLHKNYDSIRTVLTPFFAKMALKLHPFESIWSRASRYFKTERLRRVFTFATMYMGMSPFDAPSTYSLLQYTEAAEGIWYPRGGFQTVLARLVDVGMRLGVKYRLSTPVRQVLTTPDGKTVTGVLLENGETILADTVVINADLVYAYSNLFPGSLCDGEAVPSTPANKTVTTYAKSLRKRDASCSSISFYWSLSRKVPELGVHNIFLANEYKESFDAIFKKQTLPDDPSFYINVPSRIDPSAAPEGRDAVVVLVPVGHLLRTKGKEDEVTAAEQDWDSVIARARASVLDTVKTRTGQSLDDLIIDEMVNTPQSWESQFNLDKGAILGLSHNFFNVLCFRPTVRAHGIQGAYFVGASTYPGTGVPIVLAGAKITVEEILRDAGVEAPWKTKEPVVQDHGVPQGRAGPMDRLRMRTFTDEMVLVVLAVLILSATVVFLRAEGGTPGGSFHALKDW